MDQYMQVVTIIIQALGVIVFFLATSKISSFEKSLTAVQGSITELNKSVIKLLERDKTKDVQIDDLKVVITKIEDDIKLLRERYHDRVNQDSAKIQVLELEVEHLKREFDMLTPKH